MSFSFGNLVVTLMFVLSFVHLGHTQSCSQVGDTAPAVGSKIADLVVIGNTVVSGRSKVFYSKNVQMNWTDANVFCNSKGLLLATVEAQADQDVIVGWASDATRANEWGFWWLGGNDLAQEGSWRWVNNNGRIGLAGEPGSYWIAGEPVTGRNARCLHVNLGWYKGGWGQHPCSTTVMRPLCMSRISTCTPTTTAKPPCAQAGDTAPADASRTADLVTIGNTVVPERAKVFYSKNVQMNWTDASAFCTSRGLLLATVEHQLDQDVIVRWASDATRANEWGFWWLGGNDLAQEGSWRWMNNNGRIGLAGEPGSYWIAGEPVTGRNARCLHVNLGWYKGGWGQHPCSTTVMRPLCMTRVSSCTATTTVAPITTTAPPPCSCGTSVASLSANETSSSVNDTAAAFVLGGKPAGQGEFPWRCALYTPSYSFFCGCTVISTNWIMTAAHCAVVVKPGEVLSVRVGSLDLTTSTANGGQMVPASQIIVHPNYRPQVYYENDLALVRLRTPLTLSPSVSPICLPFNYASNSMAGVSVQLSGWGVSETSRGGMTTRLLKAEMTVRENTDCAPFSSVMYPSQTCARAPPVSGCNGDSGGSIDYKASNNGRSYALGVVSYGQTGCPVGGSNVYTRVSSFLNYIVQTTGETFCMA